MPALPNEQPSRASGERSITVTRWPRRRRKCATHSPITPAPQMTTCLVLIYRCRNGLVWWERGALAASSAKRGEDATSPSRQRKILEHDSRDSSDAPAEWIVRIQEQRRFRIHESRSGNRRRHFAFRAIEPAVAPGEPAA